MSIEIPKEEGGADRGMVGADEIIKVGCACSRTVGRGVDATQVERLKPRGFCNREEGCLVVCCVMLADCDYQIRGLSVQQEKASAETFVVCCTLHNARDRVSLPT